MAVGTLCVLSPLHHTEQAGGRAQNTQCIPPPPPYTHTNLDNPSAKKIRARAGQAVYPRSLPPSPLPPAMQRKFTCGFWALCPGWGGSRRRARSRRADKKGTGTLWRCTPRTARSIGPVWVSVYVWVSGCGLLRDIYVWSLVSFTAHLYGL